MATPVLDPGSVALISGAAVAVITAVTTSMVKILTAIRATSATSDGKLDVIHQQVNGSAAAAAAKLSGLEREAQALRDLVAAQKLSIDALSLHLAELRSVMARHGGRPA